MVPKVLLFHLWLTSWFNNNILVILLVLKSHDGSVSVFPDPFQRIQQKLTARVPILTGVNQDDGTVFTLGQTSLPAFLSESFGSLVTPDEVRALYPGESDTQIIPTVLRDFVFLWYVLILLPLAKR